MSPKDWERIQRACSVYQNLHGTRLTNMTHDTAGFKPRVAALLDIMPYQRPVGWFDSLVRATFDLPPGAPYTPEQRNACKQAYYCWIYGAMVNNATVAAFKEKP